MANLIVLYAMICKSRWNPPIPFPWDGEKNPILKGRGCSSESLNQTPNEDQSGLGLSFIRLPKRYHSKTDRQRKAIVNLMTKRHFHRNFSSVTILKILKIKRVVVLKISLRATLKDTLMGINIGGTS